MPKLFSSKHIINILKSHGFEKVGQKGSHVKFRWVHFILLLQAGLDKSDF